MTPTTNQEEKISLTETELRKKCHYMFQDLGWDAKVIDRLVDICAAFYHDGEESATEKLQEKHKRGLEEARKTALQEMDDAWKLCMANQPDCSRLYQLRIQIDQIS
jgi:hypothetical protein